MQSANNFIVLNIREYLANEDKRLGEGKLEKGLKDMKELKSSLDTIRGTASELITGIERAFPHLDDLEMEELCHRVIGKLRSMTEGEFE